MPVELSFMVCLGLCVAGRELTQEKISICTPPGRELLTDRRIGVLLTTIDAYARGCFLIPKNALEPKSVRITGLDRCH